MASSSSSVLSQIGTDSSATYSEISGTCGTGLSRVLARTKALRSGIMRVSSFRGAAAASPESITTVRYCPHDIAIADRFVVMGSELRAARGPGTTASIYARHQAQSPARRSLQAPHLRHLQDRCPSPDVLARGHRIAPMVRRAMYGRRPRDDHRRHRQHLGKEQGERAQNPFRLASGNAESCRLARLRAWLRLRARSRARDA